MRAAWSAWKHQKMWKSLLQKIHVSKCIKIGCESVWHLALFGISRFFLLAIATTSGEFATQMTQIPTNWRSTSHSKHLQYNSCAGGCKLKTVCWFWPFSSLWGSTLKMFYHSFPWPYVALASVQGWCYWSHPRMLPRHQSEQRKTSCWECVACWLILLSWTGSSQFPNWWTSTAREDNGWLCHIFSGKQPLTDGHIGASLKRFTKRSRCLEIQAYLEMIWSKISTSLAT